MTTTTLFHADDRLFVDLDALNLIRFEGDGDDATAHLKFKDGSAEIVHGESARNLRVRLAGIAIGEGRSTSSEVPSVAPESDSHQRTLRVDVATGLLGRNKAWFYAKDKSGRGLILAFVNAKGSCSLRPFDSESGIAHGKRYGSGPYQEQFADLIEGAIELTVDSQPNLERDCKQRLPERLLAHLRKQIENLA